MHDQEIELGQYIQEEKHHLDLVILRENLEIKKIFEQRKHLEPRPRMWEKRSFEQKRNSEVRKVSEITHQEDHLKNKTNFQNEKLCIPQQSFFIEKIHLPLNIFF